MTHSIDTPGLIIMAKSVLAIHGGAPLRATPMPSRLAVGPEEEAMIAECLGYYRERREDPGYQGHFEVRYCDAFAAFMGGGYADAVATGTAAVFLALAALELPKGSQVICSPITDPGSLSAITMNNLVPRLADARPGSYNMGSEQVAARLAPEVRAILVVHAAGQATDIDAIVALAKERGIRVVEDCSQAHGATLNGRPVGSFGDIAAFSTMYRKASITGASGGVVYSRDLSLHRMALAHADRGKPRWIEGFDDRDPSRFLFPALNLHTDELSCAIGIASLARLPETIARRRTFVARLAELMAEAGTRCRPFPHSGGDSPFIHPVAVDAGRLSCTKTEFAMAVRAEGIGLNPHYQYLVADWPYLRSYLADAFDTPNARAARDGSFCLYLNEKYGEREAEDCVAAMIKVERAMTA